MSMPLKFANIRFQISESLQISVFKYIRTDLRALKTESFLISENCTLKITLKGNM